MNWTNFLLVLSSLNHDGFFVSFHSSNAIFIVITIIFDFEISKFLLGWRNYYATMDYRNGERGYTFYARERRKRFFRNLLENPKEILWRFLITVCHKFYFKILFFHLFELRIKSLNTFQNRKIILWICLLEISKSLQIKSSSKFKILSWIPPCSLHQNLWRHESNSEFYEFSSQLNSNRHF